MKVHSIHTTDSNVKCDISSPIRKPALALLSFPALVVLLFNPINVVKFTQTVNKVRLAELKPAS